MAILEGCCCFSTVRKGSYACAVYTMLYDGVSLVILPLFIHAERSYYSGNDTKPRSSSFLETDTISPTTMVFNVLMLICACLSLVASFLLLYGLQKDSRIFLVPWIFAFTAQTTVDLMHNVYLIAVNIEIGINPVATIIYTFDFFLFAMNIYALLCVVSQYQEYKAGRGTADDPCKSRVKYSSHQTGISCLSTRKPATYHETTNSPTGNHSTLMPSTLLSAEDYPSPVHRPRKGSHRHVQFGSFDDTRSKATMPKTLVGISEGNELPSCLGVVAEEPSWVLGENSSGAPLCGESTTD